MMQLSASEVQYELKHIRQDQVPRIIASYATCLSLAYIAVALRLAARRLSRASLQADDLTVFIALVRMLLQEFSKHLQNADAGLDLAFRYRSDHCRLV